MAIVAVKYSIGAKGSALLLVFSRAVRPNQQGPAKWFCLISAKPPCPAERRELQELALHSN